MRAGRRVSDSGALRMTWILLAVCGAGAARALWVLLAGYERMAAARDELDDSLHEHPPGTHNSDEDKLSDENKLSEEDKPAGGPNTPI